jgi:tetratricopeptide (TPR) repeat protein
MPKAKAYDGGHTVFTDHRIALKPKPQPLTSYFGRAPTNRDLGLAYVQIGMDQRDSSYFEKAWPLLRQAGELKAVDAQLYSTIGALLRADGHKEQAAAYSRLSLEQDPVQPDVLNKLAELVGEAEASRLRRTALTILPHPF